MADAIQQAINDTRRIPNLVLTGHVHNYQRIEKSIHVNIAVPFLVAGVDHEWSYLVLSVDAKTLSGVATTVARDGKITRNVDRFSYPVAALSLPRGAMAEL